MSDEKVIAINKSGCGKTETTEDTTDSLRKTNRAVPKSDSSTKTDNIPSIDCATSPMPSPSKLQTSVTENKPVNCRTIPLPNELGNDLVEEIRRNTGLSYKLSCVAVETVLGQIGIKIPEVSILMDRIHGTLFEVSIL